MSILKVIHESIPPGFNPKFETAGCFIENNGEFLMLKRQENKLYGGTWCLPAGKRDSETIQECVIRETFEETGIVLDKSKLIYLKTVYVDNPGLQFTYHMFIIKIEKRPTPKLKSEEHTEYKWVTPREALCMNLLPGQEICTRIAYKLE